MKAYIITFLIALAVTAWVFDTGSPPQGIKAGVTDIKPTIAGNKHGDQLVGDFQIEDGYRPMTMLNNVLDDSDPRAKRDNSDFPYWSPN